MEPPTPAAALLEVRTHHGTYAILLRLHDTTTYPNIGQAFQNVSLPSGYHTYIGSAHGAGGVRARVRHHIGHAASPRWHLDFVRPSMIVEAVWVTYDPEKRECLWASVFRRPGDLANHAKHPARMCFTARHPEPSVGGLAGFAGGQSIRHLEQRKEQARAMSPAPVL